MISTLNQESYVVYLNNPASTRLESDDCMGAHLALEILFTNSGSDAIKYMGEYSRSKK
jgi:hypothetical protein